MSTFDIRFKQSGFKVSHSKVPSSEWTSLERRASLYKVMDAFQRKEGKGKTERFVYSDNQKIMELEDNMIALNKYI